MSPSVTPHRPQPPLRRLRSISSSFKSTKNLLKASTEPILRAFRVPLPEHAEFPRGKPAIADWANNVVTHYGQQDSDLAIVYRRRMGTLRIKEIRWYRKFTGIEHEYVIAVVADPQNTCERYIRLDRERDDPGVDVVDFPDVSHLAHNRFTRSTFSFSSSETSLSYDDQEDIDKSRGCLDVMRILYELPENDRLIERSVFRGTQNGNNHPPVLLDLALIAKAVHDNNNYYLWPRQCVWFSTMIVRVLQTEFHHQVTHQDSSLTFQNWMMDVLGEGIGTTKAKAIYRDQEEVTSNVIMAYRNSLEEVTRKIEHATMRVTRYRENDIVDEVVAQRDEATAMAAAAAANSAEATERAADAEARAAEAEARAEREARLRQDAEEQAHEIARMHAFSEREVRDLRRRLEEMEAQSRGKRYFTSKTF